MNTKRIIIIFLAILVLTSGLLLFQKYKKSRTVNVLPEATPSIEQRIEGKVKGITIPEDTEKIELTNVSEIEGMGIATKNEVVADLPELKKGEVYRVLLSNGAKSVLLGNLKEAKGGWILTFDLSKYPEYNNIIVEKSGKTILTGSF